MSIKDYGRNATAMEEWLPWGGIVVAPFVMRQKDASYFAVISYDAIPEDTAEHIPDWDFCRGWIIWSEHHHRADGTDKEYLVLFWKPFVQKGKPYIENALKNKTVRKEKDIDFFIEVAQTFCESMKVVAPTARLIEYQELIDFLSYSLTFGMDHVEMPDVPLYLDVLLHQNNTFEFTSNDIYINKERLVIISLIGLPDVEPIYQNLKNLNFKHVRRFTMFGPNEGAYDMKQYTSHWCPSRKIVKNAILDGIENRYNGYYFENIELLLGEEDYEPFLSYIEHALRKMECGYILESFNLKEVFWGSLPGLYLANNVPPLIGFQHLEELMHRIPGKHENKGKFQAILESLKNEKEKSKEQEEPQHVSP